MSNAYDKILFTGAGFSAHREFWKKQLDESGAEFVLRGFYLRKDGERRLRGYSFNLSSEAEARLKKISKGQEPGIFTVLVSAAALVLGRYTGQNRVLLAAPPLKDSPDSVMLSIEIREGIALRKYLGACTETVAGSYSYGNFPVKEFFAEHPNRDAFTSNVLLWSAALHGNTAETQDHDFIVGIGADAKEIVLRYNEGVIDEYLVNSFAKHLDRILSQYDKLDETLRRFELLDEDGKEAILQSSQGEQRPSDLRTIHAIFAERAKDQPGNTALEVPGKQYSYAELNGLTNRLAHYIRKKYSVQPGDIIAVMQERSAFLIAGLLGVLKSGATYLPVDPSLPEERIEMMIRDSGAKAILMHSDHFPKLKNCMQTPMFAMDFQLEALEETSGDIVSGTAADPAYLIYTSGSTGLPKGVLVEHGNFVNMSLEQVRGFGIEESDRVLQFASPSFDASLSEIFMAFFAGATLVIPGKGITQDTEQFSSYINEKEISVVTLPPSYLHALDRETVSSGPLRTIITAGEAAIADDARYYAQKKKYFNAYGPTETAVCASLYRVDANAATTDIIPIGRPIANTAIYILDAGLNLLPEGLTGEICIAGAGVARGYLNRAELNAEKFLTSPFVAGERLYRTGDMGRRLPDGNIEFLGRRDEQLKIRGFRIEAGEIEQQLLRHPGIRSAAVIAAGSELSLFFTSAEEMDSAELRNFLARSLPDYMLPAHFIRVEEMPLSNSGKIDKKALMEISAGTNVHSGEYSEPEGRTEIRLAEIWKEYLRRERIGRNDNFFELGGHSLIATQIAARIRREFDADISIQDIFLAPTVAGLAGNIDSGGKHSFSAIEPLPSLEWYELSHAQKRLWILSRMGNGAAYNMTGAYRIRGDFDRKAFARAWQAIVDRHESFRTSFHELNGEVKQKIRSQREFSLTELSLPASGDENEELRKILRTEAERNFDLERDELLRVTLVSLGQNEYAFICNMHHIVADGWSIAVLIRELLALYRAFSEGGENPFEPLRIQYRDYAAWQNRILGSDEIDVHRAYWREKLDGAAPFLNFPADHPRPALKSYNGASTEFFLEYTHLEELRSLAKKEQASIFMLLVTAIKILLYRESAQEDIIIGTPVSGREHADLDGQIGFYVNTPALRDRISPGDSFTELLRKVKQTTLEAYKYQFYPFDRVIEDLNIVRDPGRSPLFETGFTWENADDIAVFELDHNGIGVQPLPLPAATAKYDLWFFGRELKEGISFSLEYNTDIFSAATAERISQRLVQIIRQVLEDPALPITALRLGEEMLREESTPEFEFDF